MINRLNNYLKDKKEEFYGPDCGLKLDGTLDLEGSSQLLIPARFLTVRFSKGDTKFVACTKHSQGICVHIDTRLKNIQWDGPRRDV